MNAEETIPSNYVQGFTRNLNMVPQQTDARLISYVDADLSYSVPGKMFNADFSGTSEPLPVTGRAPPSPEGFVALSRRVGFFKPFADGKFVDDLDKARMLADPTNGTMQAMRAGKMRAMDDKVIEAATGTAREGENGETSVAFPSSQVIAVDNRNFLHDAENVPASGALPLTIGKIITAGVMLDASEIEGEKVMAVSAVQLGNLLSSTPATAAEYNSVKGLVNGAINQLLGFTFVRTERLKKSGNNRSVLAWKKPAIVYKAREVINATIGRRLDRSNRWYAYYEFEHDAVRVQDKGVVEILAAENVY